MRALERFMLLQIIDERWREHLHDMDYLREGIHLRGFAQIDPLVAYKNEGFEMFTELMNNIWDEFARYIFNVEVAVEEEQQGAGPELGRRLGLQHRRRPAQLLRRPHPPRAATRSPPRRGPPCPRAWQRPPTWPPRRWRPRSRSWRPAAWTRTRSWAATTRVGAARARSSRSAMAPDDSASGLRDQLTLLADYL